MMFIQLPASAIRRTSLLVLLALLVLAQTLGLMHRLVHAPQGHHTAGSWGAAQAVGVDAAPAYAGVAEDSPGQGHWLDRLFAGHEASGCDSYDQLGHSDLLWSPPAGLCAHAVSVDVPSSNPAWHIAAQAAGYLARGPPQRA